MTLSASLFKVVIDSTFRLGVVQHIWGIDILKRPKSIKYGSLDRNLSMFYKLKFISGRYLLLNNISVNVFLPFFIFKTLLLFDFTAI